MNQIHVIGHLGGDAQVKTANGREFVTFRVANTDRWKDDAGQEHENTMWIDCVINQKTAVFDYLKKGTLVFVSGPVSTRLYSSAKDRCMKAGLQLSVRNIELIGGKADEVPSRLYDPNTGAELVVTKHYYCAQLVRNKKEPEFLPLVSRSNGRFIVDRNGWVSQFVDEQQETSAEDTNNQSKDAQG